MIGYNGDPAGGGLTSPVPGPHVIPAALVPQDTDPPNAATFLPSLETNLDWAAYFQLNRSLGDARGGDSTSFDGTSNPTTWNDLLTNVGTPISGLGVLPEFAAGSGFAVTIGDGSGNLYTSTGIHPGESAYREIYWSSQSLTHANPHASLPRIDVITVTPAAPGSASTLAIVTGTAATTPLAPAIPAGSGPVFYVLVPAAAANSASFRACRGIGRRVEYPWSGMSAIISGVEISWEYLQDPASGSASMYIGAADKTGTNATVNRILIDGEIIEWVGFSNDTAVSDSTADPFGTTASSSFDRPYYIYACGGRHNPLPQPAAFSASLSPVTFCESTVPPNPKTGKPTGNLTVNGVTVTPNGALYIGLGFIAQGTSHRRACLMDGEMTLSLNPLQFINHTFTTNAAEDIGTFSTGCQPAISTKMRLNMIFAAPTAAFGSALIRLENFPIASGLVGVLAGSAAYAGAAGQTVINGLDMNFTPRSGAELWAILSSASIAGASLLVGAMGFNHRVRRLIAGY